VNVIRRHGFSKLTLDKIDTLFKIKAYFDDICGCNIYDLFYDEIREVSFQA